MFSSRDGPKGTEREYSIDINGTPDRIWQALTDEVESSAWYYGTGVTSTWHPGAEYAYKFPDGTVAIKGTVLAVSPPNLVEMSFSAQWDDEVMKDEATRVTWTILERGGSCRVAVRHVGATVGSATESQFTTGWPDLLSRLKAFVERGEPEPKN